MGTSLVMKNRRDWFMEKIRANSAGLKALVVGQIISLLLTCTGWSSSMLVRKGIHAPLTQSFLIYSLYTIVFGSMLIYRRKGIQISWYWYLLLAAIDIESNYIGLKAYQYTSITSVMLLDCWTIPCVLFLTWQFLKTRYHTNHFVGVAICMGGLVVVIFSDVHSEDRVSGGSDHVLLGDTLVVVASMCYAILNVSEEFVVKKVDLVEYLGHIGFFGMIISGCQLVVLESKHLESIDWNVNTITLFITFALSCLAFSSLVPWLLRMNGAAMLNLSLLTSDMWAVAVRALGFHEAVDGLYFVAFGLVALGLLVYASAEEPPHIAIAEDSRSEPDSVEYTLIEHLEKESVEP